MADSLAFGALKPAAVFQPCTDDEVVESAVRPDLERAVYTTLHRVVCLTRAGDVVDVTLRAVLGRPTAHC
ncbi:hypothetical protein [Streptomyces sp. NPDC057494]|uniref:hypothetical protein n=1 Tax=Streptomyces sp. NPDC057494 TaxID=3346148 RepID=UPI0036B489A9